MDVLFNLCETAITRYFENLSQFGYRKYSDVNKLLILLFLDEFLSGEFSYFITEKDYRHIINSLYCLMGNTCLIDFPMLESLSTLINSDNINFIPKVTEDDLLRITQDNSFRVKA